MIDKSAVIYEKGCLRAGEEWIESNLIPIAISTVITAIIQVMVYADLRDRFEFSQYHLGEDSLG